MSSKTFDALTDLLSHDPDIFVAESEGNGLLSREAHDALVELRDSLTTAATLGLQFDVCDEGVIVAEHGGDALAALLDITGRKVNHPEIAPLTILVTAPGLDFRSEGSHFVVGHLQAAEPNALPSSDTIRVVRDPDLDDMGLARVSVHAATREAVIEYVREHWGDEDALWFETYVVGRVESVSGGFASVPA